MKFKKNSIETGFDIFNVVFMIVLMLVTVYPILYILFASVSDAGLLMQHRGFLLVPLGVNFDSYIAVFKNPLILTGFRNTLFVVIVGSAVNILMTFLAAYFLSRKKLLWKRFVMIMIVITMFFGGGMIPCCCWFGSQKFVMVADNTLGCQCFQYYSYEDGIHEYTRKS